jgi:LmbE family N-acetylglucosaminyl deacetylase
MGRRSALVEKARRIERAAASSVVASARATLARFPALAWAPALVETALISTANRGFSSRLVWDPTGPVVVLSPHFDDAVLSCWSVLTGAGTVQAVNLFAAPPTPGYVTPYDRVCGARDSSDHVRRRAAEDVEALEIAGRAPVNLQFLDRQYRRPWQTPRLKDLDARLAEAVPRPSALYAPAAIGFVAGHVDHRLARSLALAAGRNAIPVHLYADLPYAAMFGWPAWVAGTLADPVLDVDAYWQQLAVDVPQIGGIRAARVVGLAADEASRKLTAMEAYRTQFRALDGGPIGMLRNPAIHGFEVFWEAKAVT